MRYHELIKKLRHLDCEFVRQAGGSHEIWHNPHTGGVTVIPHHSREIAKKTLNKILRELGLKPEDLQGI
ncbi:MAG: type II toxin-antitoxin system HicA family toxin [Anaerolineae bacterium]|jgi:predicted RNA binding protein YcfA (HicA-like mRNA interferase family)|nr:type II toxin-antitoxin system HicA family toxin [Anaerolineae bacterium]MDH7474640.1 type II toxin-antitoxin system HicA family toxin [Anaerolineae bacterium]